MSIDHWNRSKILSVLGNAQAFDRSDILKALYDIRYNTGDNDEEILFGLLDHHDDGVVASVIYSLWHSYDCRSELIPLIKAFARGDEQDRDEMSIQSMAIDILKEIASTDADALEELREIAEDGNVCEVPHVRAWRALAAIHGVAWSRRWSEEFILRPDSDVSQSIRDSMRKAMNS